MLLLLLLLVSTAVALNCPNGYTALNDAKCIQLISQTARHSDAVATCSSKNGVLASINNIFENNGMLQFLQQSQINTPVWLGIKCTESQNPSSCYWDDKSGSSGAFNNFASGYPNVDIGSCAYLQTNGKLLGKWISGDCDFMTLSFVCETNQVQPATCTYQHNNYCYFPTLQSVNENQAQYACQQLCGNLVSIHSDDENNYVASLFGNNPPEYVRLGATYDFSANIKWLDQSNVDYTNFGISNPNLGSCLSMSLVDEIVGQRKWISSHCQNALPFVCKRPITETCQTLTTQAPVTNPAQCVTPTIYDGSGSFSSPGFPDSYIQQKSSCVYILTTPATTLTKIQFPTLVLDANSQIDLYYEIEDSVPFRTLTGVQTAATWFVSNTNTIKVIFRTKAQVGFGQYRWEAKYTYDEVHVLPTRSPVTITPDPGNPSGCNGTSLVTPGIITSPNYPNNYPSSTNCLYLLQAYGGYKIALVFKDVTTETCCDIIVVHDGPSVSSRELGRVSGYAPADSLHFVSSTNRMLVTFSSDSSTEDRGFKATFEAVTVV